MNAVRCCGLIPTVLIALASWLVAGPATAEETAYLLYLKGTEGKTTPFRVRWDERDDGNGRITIDFGVGYEGFLKNIGLPRLLSLDAQSNRGDYVVRNPELERFVKLVVTEIVRPPERASLGGRATPPPPQADVKGALLLITPTPDKDQLEVTVRLHIMYPAPQRSGPPIVKDFVNGDFVFVGPREPKDAGQKDAGSKGPAQKSR
jgi:hypothetical protein